MNENELKKKKLLQDAYNSNMQFLGLADAPQAQAKQAPAVKAKPVVKKKPAVKLPVEPSQSQRDEVDDLISKLQMANAVEEQESPAEDSMEIAEEPIREPASKGYDLGGWEDTIALGAGPLLSLLGGASPAVFNMHMDKANKGAGVIGEEAKVTKDKLVALKGDDGTPYYEMAQNAVGKQPYYQPKAAGGANGDRQFAPIPVKNSKTGEVAIARVTGMGLFDPYSGEMFDRDWLPFKKDDILRSRTMEGGYLAKARSQYDGSLKPVDYVPGLGDRMGGVSKEEASAGIKSAVDAKKGSQKAVEGMSLAQSAMGELERLEINPSPEAAARAFYMLVKATNGERVSDSDYANLRGLEFKSYVRQFEDWASGRIKGQVSPKAIAAFKDVARSIVEQKKKEINAIKQNYTPSTALPQQGQKIIEDISGQSNRQQTNTDWKSGLKSFGK